MIEPCSRRALLGFSVAGWLAAGRPAWGQFLKARDRAPAPELTEVSAWINSDPLTMKGLRGKVVVVHFWTHGCFNCVNNYPHYLAWQERYAREKDLVILGIHTPETTGERAVDRIKQQAAKHGLKFPIAVDNDAANWQAWNNRDLAHGLRRRPPRGGPLRLGRRAELQGQKGEETVRKTIDAFLRERA